MPITERIRDETARKSLLIRLCHTDWKKLGTTVLRSIIAILEEHGEQDGGRR